METFDCPICLNSCVNKFVTNCKHVFCVNCINAYSELTNNMNCPLCRALIIFEKLPYEEKMPFDQSRFIDNPNINDPMILSGYNTISRLNMWKFLYDYRVNNNSGFMFSTEKEINDIMNNIDKDYNCNHSGCTMGYTMRHLQFIAYYGIDRYLFFNNNTRLDT